MGLGFNSNVEFAGRVYHVQTEDRGLHHPFVDTLVLSAGRVVYRRSSGYQDLLVDGAVPDAVLRERVEQQHRAIIDGVRTGALLLGEEQFAPISARLRNPMSWLSGGQATLEIEVSSRSDQRPVAGADVRAFIEAADGEKTSEVKSRTDSDGRTCLRFRMPPVADHANPSLVIRVQAARAEDELRYRLRPRPQDAAPPPR